jgi:hypothetical protein
MSERQIILNGLQGKRAELEARRPPLEAEFERIALKKKELDEAMAALDIVIAQFGGTISASPDTVPAPSEQPFQLQPRTNGHANGGADRPIGLKSLAKKHFDELPTEYTKEDVVEVLRKYRPDLQGPNENTLNGVTRELCRIGYARILTPFTGRSPQVYLKLR